MTSNEEGVKDSTCLPTELNSILYLTFRVTALYRFIANITDTTDVMDSRHDCIVLQFPRKMKLCHNVTSQPSCGSFYSLYT